MADLDGRPPPELGQLKREPASHRFTASRAVSDRQSRNVEGQVEADDRSAQVVGPSKQDFVDEFGNGPQDKSTLAAERSKQRKIVSADESWVVEETSLIKFVCLAKLICADAQTLRRVDSRLGVEDKRLELSESEFLRRVDHRSRSRYDEPFPESLLADLHKDDLIPELERSGNEGLSPKYFATWRHYRRALQLQRLRSVGIKGRDALRVQLFVRGYGLKVFEVRDAVRRELLRGLSELRPPLRSQYFHSQRDPGPAHLAAVERQLGSIDPRLESAGFKQPTQFMLKQIRLGFGVLSRSLLAPLEGLLLAGLNDHPLPKLIEEALNASDDDYMSARVALAWMERTAFRPEPLRVDRRLFGLSHAALAGSSSMA
jgi:hypothetical protein